MSAKPRSLLKLDQAYIAVGGREHLTLVRETDIMDHAHHCASEISPRAAEVPTHQHSICRDAEVPSSTQSAPYLPLGLISMRIEQIRESSPWASIPEQQSSRYVSPWYAQYPKRQGDVSPHTPSPLAGLLMAPLSVSSHGVPRLSGI